MARVVRFREVGGPDVLKVGDVEVPAPKAGEVQIRVKAMGLNRAEVMFRTGQYVTQPSFPVDPVGGREVGKILEALSFLGIFFQYGALETTPLSVPVLSLLGKDLTLRGYQLFEITQDAARLERAKRFVVDGLAAGKLRPVIAKTFKLDEIVEAHRYMEANEQIGKIVVTV